MNPHPNILRTSYFVLASAALAATAASAADAGFTLGIPGAPKIRATSNVLLNEWLSSNATFTAMSAAVRANSMSLSSSAGAAKVTLAAAETGFAIERTKPEYYLGDEIEPPDDVDWSATYERFVADASQGFLFDASGERVFVTEGGTLSFTWIAGDGAETRMTYVTSASCAGRPRRIYWTDEPYNAPSVDMNGKFVKFFGSSEILEPRYGIATNLAAGVSQVVSNKVVSGLIVDSASHSLFAYGELQGQVVMAYYDTGTYEHMLHVQAVEVCRPSVNVLKGEIGKALKPDGRGYGTAGLMARPTVVSPSDGRGEYLYAHKGRYSYSPKNGNVYPLRPTKDCRWNAEVYWMETDEMEVQWPFEIDHYECDWPQNTTVFVRGTESGDYGRPVYVPSDYSAMLMDYQEPDGHARAVTADGTFSSVGEGFSLLKLTTDDNIWFVPVHSVLRTNNRYFTLEPQDIRTGRELVLRGGAVAGTAAGFSPECDASSPGYIYKAASGTQYNPNLYIEPVPESQEGAEANASAASSGESDTNKYESVIYAVRPDGADGKGLEVWWNTTIRQEDMPVSLTIPTLPQVYSVRWPIPGETPQIVIASQLGSASSSEFSRNAGAYLSSERATLPIPSRTYFNAAEGGTVMLWVKPYENLTRTPHEVLSLWGEQEFFSEDNGRSNPFNTYLKVLVWREAEDAPPTLKVVVNDADEQSYVAREREIVYTLDDADAIGGWHSVAVTLPPMYDDGGALCKTVQTYCDGGKSDRFTLVAPDESCRDRLPSGGTVSNLLEKVDFACIGTGEWSGDSSTAATGAAVGEVLFWNRQLSEKEVNAERMKSHTAPESHLTGCFSFVEGTDLVVSGSDERIFTDKVLGTRYTATEVLLEENGPPAAGTGVIDADPDTTPKVYVQNDPAKTGYNPNEEHAIIRAGSGGHVVWALRNDLNTAESSEPGVLVEYVKGGRKAMQWFGVALTNSVYPELAADCVAGKALPGPHPLDFFDDPWKKETYWDEVSATTPAFRDRKLQLWARAAGDLHVHMYYPMQDGFAFPSIEESSWPKTGEPVPWLSCLGYDGIGATALERNPAAWLWRIKWPDEVPEMEIGRTLTVASSGLPEVWNAKSVGVVWPATDEERDATAVLFDPTVAQTTGFSSDDYASLSEAIADLGIKTGAGGNATLRKGRYTFDGLPPSVSARFYVDTTADLGRCIKLVGEKEYNAGGVELLHVNVLNPAERAAIEDILKETASKDGLAKWKAAIAKLATAPVLPSPHSAVSETEDRVDYVPRDHYALFSMGATNYVTLVENDSTHELMNVSPGDPISMHVFKVVPKYYTGRVVTREDPNNLLSQQLSVIYAEAFAGRPDDYVFEWRKCRPHPDGSVPLDFNGEYEQKFAPEAGLTRFVIGAQGDTLANMVNTYYAMRYRAANEKSPAYAAMGYGWSEWTDPPALAEGWVQRVLNNVTPFAQRMRDLVENEAETAVSMIRQAGAPYEGDVALNQDNLKEVGLIQLYETLLSKAESMSLQLGINDADANKQLQLAVARLADLYNTLGDEAYTDALNPTIGFGANFNTPEKCDLNLEYGALSSSLFAFDNQVPTLLDEELALLRGRSGENAPSPHISPYYNRLVWNFTRGMTGGEVAYAMNYDVSGNGKGVIDYSQAAEMYPQGHGDAYGHYLSALSGYYRLLRNPYFSWGVPAMGEMVVADGVVNVDYYDEAQFAKAAYNVAKTALEATDRTARKAYRDSGGAAGAGYLDTDETRNFGYGEWGSRGGYGALCNWAVANSILEAEPRKGSYSSFRFTGDVDSLGICAFPSEDDVPVFDPGRDWTVEFQVTPGAFSESAMLFLAADNNAMFGVRLDESGMLSVGKAQMAASDVEYEISALAYMADGFDADVKESEPFCMAVTNGHAVSQYWFYGDNPPASLPPGYDPAGGEYPSWDGWQCLMVDDNGDPVPYVETVNETFYDKSDAEEISFEICPVATNAVSLVALRNSGGHLNATVFDASGAKIADTNLETSIAVTPNIISAGMGFIGEIGELRVWNTARTDAELLAKRGYANPMADEIELYLRTIAPEETDSLADEATPAVTWHTGGGAWIPAAESGMAIEFTDEGLKRIHRGTVDELVSLANIVPLIQTAVDRVDSGLNPLGLASGAIPFDLTPVSEGDESRTHYEQIRDRAATALSNARKMLERAQTAGNRLRLLQEAQVAKEESLNSMELEMKNTLIEYFGYPYEGDIGPGGTYPQGYDGPDLYHYQWMNLADLGLTEVEDVVTVTVTNYATAVSWDQRVPNLTDLSKVDTVKALKFEKSATGIIQKPSSITGRRRAQGRIQDALAEFLIAYGTFKRTIDGYKYATDQFYYDINAVISKITRDTFLHANKEANFIIDKVQAASESALKITVNTLEYVTKLSEDVQESTLDSVPGILGAGMTVNADPRSVVAGAVGPVQLTLAQTAASTLLTAKNSLVGMDTIDIIRDTITEILELANDMADEFDSDYQRAREASEKQYDAGCELKAAWQNLQVAQSAVESVAAEAERVIDQRTLARSQAVDSLTKARYSEMFARLERNNALSRYSTAFDLAQKYVYLAAQAYDYETGLLKSDAKGGERFIAEIVGARTLGEFDGEGNPLVTSGNGDGGLADILARMDANWLVLKPRLGINNPQPYATWFSLREELFRIYGDERGDKSWRTELRKHVVKNIKAIPEFRRFCQPLAGSAAVEEPGFVIPFPTSIVFGENFFGKGLVGGDSSLDPTWFATRISSAGIHFEGYNQKTENGKPISLPLSKTPSCYLVPVGEDVIRSPSDPETTIFWKIVDQTIPAPYAIGSTELDNPDWTPLFDGVTGGNDLGARIRRHPSFRAYYGKAGDDPEDSELDCTRLVGRSAWNTKWLLIIPAGSMGADREAAIKAFIEGADTDNDGVADVSGVSDIRLGLKTYSTSGN